MKKISYYIFALTLLLAAVLTSCSDNQKVKKLAKNGSLAGYRVGVVTGTTYDIFARKYLKSSTIVQSATFPDEIILLETDKLDAVIMELSLLKKLQAENPNIVVQNDSIYANHMGIGFSKKRTDLRDKFNIFLKEIKKSGMYDQIYDRWIIRQDADMPVIPNDGFKGVITCQTDNTTPLFSYVRNGKPAGFDMEIVLRFGAWMHQKIDIKNGTFAALVSALSTSTVDMGTACIAITPERARNITFSDVYYSCNTGVITLKSKMANMEEKSKQPKLTKNGSLAGLRVAVQTGSVQAVYASKHLTSSILIHCTSIPDKLLLVKEGKADVALLDYTMAKMTMEKDPELMIVKDSLYGGTLSFAFNKQNKVLLGKFNQFLKKLRQSGEYTKLYDKWFNHIKTAQMPPFENKGTNGTIICQTDCDSPPHCIMRDGKLAGFNIELVERFAESLNMKLEMPITNLSGIIAAVSAGKADMTCTAMCGTPERKKNMDFSDPYCYYHACGVGLKKNVAGYANQKTVNKKGVWDDFSESFKQNFIVEKRYEMIIDGLICTMEITIFAGILGTVLGSLICYMRMRKNRLVNQLAKTYILLFRGIPQVVLLMILFYAVFASSGIDGISVSVIGFSLVMAAYVSEMFRSSISSISHGQTEAGLSMGFTPLQTFRYIVLPLTIRRVLPVYKGEIIGLIKSTSIVGYITVQDLTKVSDIIRSATFDAFMPLIMISIVYFIIIWLFSLLLDAIDFKYKPKKRKFYKA